MGVSSVWYRSLIPDQNSEEMKVSFFLLLAFLLLLSSTVSGHKNHRRIFRKLKKLKSDLDLLTNCNRIGNQFACDNTAGCYWCDAIPMCLFDSQPCIKPTTTTTPATTAAR